MKRQIIRLTESELHTIVSEAVANIIRKTSGRVRPSGNPMTAGSYGECDFEIEEDITDDLFVKFDNAMLDMGEEFEEEHADDAATFRDYVDDNTLKVAVAYREEYDTSTGVEPYVSVLRVYDANDIEGDIRRLGMSEEVTKIALKALRGIINAIDGNEVYSEESMRTRLPRS